jgi:glycosyltransferase involved in cell wall biosynthesis
MKNISCIIPVFNEGKQVAYILEFLKEYERVDEVIIVDDGSNDKTSDIVKETIIGEGKFKFLQHKVNLGKAAAVKSGLDIATGDIILLSDGDICYITNYNFDILIDKLKNEVRMTVLDSSFIRKYPLSISGMTRLWSGQRAGYRADLLKLPWDKYYGYALESQLNESYRRNNWLMLYVYSYGAESILHFEKTDIENAIKRYRKIWGEITDKVSIWEMLRQRVDSPIASIEFLYFVNLNRHLRLFVIPWILVVDQTAALIMFLFAHVQTHLPRRYSKFDSS